MLAHRTAIPHDKEENVSSCKDLSLDVIQIWMTKDGGWEWFVYRTEPSGNDVRLYALVFSPHLPNGEFGTVWLSEVENFIKLELEESLPPTGYSWKNN